MKLWYQALVRGVETTPFGGLLRKVLNSFADPGTEIHIQGLSESSGCGVHYRFLEYHDTKEVIFNAMKAEREGYDAFLIGNISDAGLREAREVANIPIIGSSETNMHFACMMGATFGLITISEKWTPRIVENVNRYGLSSRLVGVEALSTSPLELKKAVEDLSLRQGVLDDVMAASKRLLKKGAEVIVPAGGDVAVFLAEAGIFEVERAPIMISHANLVKMAEMAVRLRKLTGRFTSKHLQSAPPTGDFLKRVRDFYGPDVYPGAE